jgi:hypothetical protein
VSQANETVFSPYENVPMIAAPLPIGNGADNPSAQTQMKYNLFIQK